MLLEYPDGGAVAMAGPNPCGTSVLHELITEMLKKVYDENERTLGRIIYDAKCRIIARYPWTESRYGPAVLYVILGDPALRIEYPPSQGAEESVQSVIHSNLRLTQNPVRGNVIQLQLRLDRADNVVLSLYNILGQTVKLHFLNQLSAGEYRISIPTEDLTSGVYFLSVQADKFTATKKLVLLK